MLDIGNGIILASQLLHGKFPGVVQEFAYIAGDWSMSARFGTGADELAAMFGN